MSFRILVEEIVPLPGKKARIIERYRQTVDTIDIVAFSAAINRRPRRSRAKAAAAEAASPPPAVSNE